MSAQDCPQCHGHSSTLLSVDAMTAKKYSLLHKDHPLPAQVCESCLKKVKGEFEPDLAPTVLNNFGDKEKLEIWKGRINLVKKARQAVREKHFAEAIIFYEKYLKIFEMVFKFPIEVLGPRSFKSSALSSELSVLVMVYWDLLRLYDVNENYQNKAEEICEKLKEFAPSTAIVIDLVKEIEAHKKQARVPVLFKNLARELMIKRMKLPKIHYVAPPKKAAPPADKGGHH